MKQELSVYEIRVIGVLLEKEITTPDQYPLSLNALTNACNQKSNRYPVLQLSEDTVNETVQTLTRQGLIRADHYRSRVEKYAHRFCNSEFGELQLSARAVAVLTELFLRGPQTPGELRAHASRMAAFPDMASVEQTLQSLVEHPRGPLVAMLPREPGRRESRYIHLFSGAVEGLEASPPDMTQLQAARAEAAQWKAQCERLEQENEQLKQRLRALGQVC